MDEHLLDELRAVASSLGPPPPELEPYLTKVRERASTITAADVEPLQAAGVSEDEIFEQTVSAAIALFEDGERVGAIGVSGLPGEVDEQLALRAIDATE